jgi:hypothetical protein
MQVFPGAAAEPEHSLENCGQEIIGKILYDQLQAVLWKSRNPEQALLDATACAESAAQVTETFSQLARMGPYWGWGRGRGSRTATACRTRLRGHAKGKTVLSSPQ